MFWNRMGNSGDDNGGHHASGHPQPDDLRGRPLGRVLTKMGKVTRVQVVEALVYQKEHGGLIGEIMVKLGFIQPADVDAALSAQRGR